jgi:hypothetical protein
MASKATKTNLHRETLRACLRVIHTAETLDQARTQLARMLKSGRAQPSPGDARDDPSPRPAAWSGRRCSDLAQPSGLSDRASRTARQRST